MEYYVVAHLFARQSSFMYFVLSLQEFFYYIFLGNVGAEKVLKRGWYPKYRDVHEKFNFSEMQEYRPLRTCQKHFETILPNFLPEECEI